MAGPALGWGQTDAFASTVGTKLEWQYPLLSQLVWGPQMAWECACMHVCVDGTNLKCAQCWHIHIHACMCVWTERTWNVHYVGISTKTVPSILCQCINTHMHACWNLFHRLLWCNDLAVRWAPTAGWVRNGSSCLVAMQPQPFSLFLTLWIVLLWPTQMLHFPTRQQLKTFDSVVCPASVWLSFEWNQWQKQDILPVGAFNTIFVTSTWILRNCQHSW